jgi:serine/threonine protein kinase
LIGETLDNKYRLVRLLGQGGMGSVYEAEHVETGHRVAVKLIRGDVLTNNVSLVSRFKREVKAAKAIESPHVAELSYVDACAGWSRRAVGKGVRGSLTAISLRDEYAISRHSLLLC